MFIGTFVACGHLRVSADGFTSHRPGRGGNRILQKAKGLRRAAVTSRKTVLYVTENVSKEACHMWNPATLA